jgi:hypothetical protein
MAQGFTVTVQFRHAPAVVWERLIGLDQASDWMAGVGDMLPYEKAELGLGTVLRFQARGKERTTTVSA